ncbi:hypothetical protein C8R42DRAFT_728598 [Lentinula raphanica]|nr:hypothetical protein C8R42DRAFT_728598 [Lentinula raphanica]
MNDGHPDSSAADSSDVDAETQVTTSSKKRSRGMSQNKSSQKKRCLCRQEDGVDPNTVIEGLQARIRVLEAQQVIANQALADQKKLYQNMCKRRNKYAGDADRHETCAKELEKELVVKKAEVRTKEKEAHVYVERLKNMEKRLVQIQDVCQQTSSTLANLAA